MKTYEVTFSVEGYWTWTGEAESEEEAKELALNDSEEIDCGELENVDWDICEVSCDDD